MCKLLIATTKYTGCPSSCNRVQETMVTAGCPYFAQSGTECASPKKEHLGDTKSRAQCERHRDEGYGDRNNR